jgi:hypothetical protein
MHARVGWPTVIGLGLVVVAFMGSQCLRGLVRARPCAAHGVKACVRAEEAGFDKWEEQRSDPLSRLTNRWVRLPDGTNPCCGRI